MSFILINDENQSDLTLSFHLNKRRGQSELTIVFIMNFEPVPVVHKMAIVKNKMQKTAIFCDCCRIVALNVLRK